MTELKEFFDMGGYATFIWSAYAITFVVLVLNTLITKAQLKKTQLRATRTARQRRKN